MSKDKHVKVKLEGEDYLAFINGKGDPVIVPMGTGFDSGVSCPPIPLGVCPLNYSPECRNGTVWCEFGEGDG